METGSCSSTVERANVWLQRVSVDRPVKVTNLTDLGIVRGKRTPESRPYCRARRGADGRVLVSNFR